MRKRKRFTTPAKNLEAFFKSQILDWTETPEEIEAAFSQIPGYRADDPQRESRRKLSEQARAQILKLVVNTRLSSDHIVMRPREYYLLLNRSDTPQVQEENENIRKLMDDKGLIKISDETRRLLKFMEFNSPWINGPMQRIRAISNPTYEYIDIDGFLELREDHFNELKDDLESNTTGMWDYMKVISNVRLQESLARTDSKAAVMASLKEVTRANRGFFIGSSAYSQAFHSLRSAAKLLKNMDDHPNAQEMAQAKPVLEQAIQQCRAYLEKKNAKPLEGRREEMRYNAMMHAMESCQKTLDFLDRKAKIQAAELRNDPQSKPAQPKPTDEVGKKIDQLYGPKGKLIVLPASDAGSIADELRADIYEKLNRLVSATDAFDAEEAGYVMSNMVVLEMVKDGRSLNENGEIAAGPVEKELAADPGMVLESIRCDARVQSIMADVTPEMLKQFIMTGGAKNVADSMTKSAEQRMHSQDAQEMQLQKQGSSIAIC